VALEGVLTYHGREDRPGFRLLLRWFREGGLTRLAFVKPVGATWPLPMYDLALTTAVELRDHEVDLTLITPEREPLEAFGSRVSASVRGLLHDHGIALHTDGTGVPSRPRRLHVSPGNRRLPVDRIVTLPRLVGPRPFGVPAERDGFIAGRPWSRRRTRRRVRRRWCDGFPDQAGGLAAQQADAAAEAIAASLGADIDPQPFRPVLRGILLAGNRPHYLRAEISGSNGQSSISEAALWWLPNRLCGRYLAPYLSAQVGFASDVMPQDELSASVGASLDPDVPDGRRAFATRRDLQPR
jgi:sulfide:quinone oxidoreductase